MTPYAAELAQRHTAPVLPPAARMSHPEGVALAVCLLFDPRTDRLVRELWARLEAKGVRTLQSHTHGRHHPHLSYAVLLEWDLVGVRAALEELPDKGGFEVSFQGTVAFPRGRAALAPAVPADVAARQDAVAGAVVAAGGMLHRHYAPGRWVPHVSVATRASGEALAVVVKEVADVLPLTGTVERAALIDSSTGEAWPLPGVP
ncbi:2'-5' RNA ligase family protein [Intrasporangium calvum]|uniref:2'-5' RNA ligase family protein n=1 Tax=Intrasporangium calvum TaxID=53358 RepID=A0ABT5GGW7_9MICO|nr:2'-5' RNA ligase family protein [Intrasporangium calvum]MDC5697329.1 2'-5' RNA ligase family protein [Intrasporangium calvum]